MPREQKIGFTLLILVIGLGGAFLFRKPSTSPAAFPGLPGEESINQQVAELRTRPFLPGIDLKADPQSETSHPDQRLVQELAGLQTVQAAPHARDYVPPPIGLVSETAPQRQQVPIPPETRSTDSEVPARATTHQKNVSTPRPTGEATHLVQPGETLSGIAWKYYGSASRYQEVFEANRDQLASPNHLRPGMHLRIPDVTSADGSSSHSTPDPAAEKVKEASIDEEPAVSRNSNKPAATGEIVPTANQLITDEPDLTDTRKKMFVPARHSPFSQSLIPTAVDRMAAQPQQRR